MNFPLRHFRCADCNQQVTYSVPHLIGPTRQRCNACGYARRLFLDVLSGRENATRLVATARRRGHLPEPGTKLCADCGRRAFCYDHRDYSQPLNVVAVCSSCNRKRGSAAPLNPYLVLCLIGAYGRALEGDR